MKERFGVALWILFVVGLVIFSVSAIKDVAVPKAVNIGPHEIAEITENDTFITPKANITVTGKDFFSLEDLETKTVVYSELVQAEIGEVSPHFAYTGQLVGKYQVSRSAVSIYSDTPVTITTEADSSEKAGTIALFVFLVILLFLVGSLAIVMLFA